MSKSPHDLSDDALAPSTRDTYDRLLRGFDRWLAEVDLPFTTPDEQDTTLAAFVANRFEAGHSPAYINQVLCAVRWRAVDTDQPNPIRRRARATMRGARRRGRNRGLGQVKGLTWSEVDRAATLATEENTITGDRDAALLRVGSDALLRVGEISNALAEHVEHLPDGTARLLIPYSKTDQFGDGRKMFLGPPTVAALLRWRRYRSDAGPLFTRVSKHGCAVFGPLHIQTIRSIIQRRASAAGIEGRISGHSLRVGAAISLARRGVSTAQLMRVGRWKNPSTALRYIEAELAERDAVAAFRYS